MFCEEAGGKPFFEVQVTGPSSGGPLAQPPNDSRHMAPLSFLSPTSAAKPPARSPHFPFTVVPMPKPELAIPQPLDPS